MPVTCRWSVFLNRTNEIFKYGLMSAEVADNRRRNIFAVLGSKARPDALRKVSQVCGDDSIMFQNNRSFSAGNFQPARITRESRGCCLQNTQCSAFEIEERDGCVFAFYRVQR